MADRFTISVPGKAEYVGTVRMAVSHIASKMGFDIEAIDDIKIAVSEACTNIILHAHEETDYQYEVMVEVEENNIAITVEDTGTGFGLEDYISPVPGESRGSGLGLFVIRALMDEVDIQTEPGSGTRVRMSKGLQSVGG